MRGLFLYGLEIIRVREIQVGYAVTITIRSLISLLLRNSDYWNDPFLFLLLSKNTRYREGKWVPGIMECPIS